FNQINALTFDLRALRLGSLLIRLITFGEFYVLQPLLCSIQRPYTRNFGATTHYASTVDNYSDSPSSGQAGSISDASAINYVVWQSCASLLLVELPWTPANCPRGDAVRTQTSTFCATIYSSNDLGRFPAHDARSLAGPFKLSSGPCRRYSTAIDILTRCQFQVVFGADTHMPYRNGFDRARVMPLARVRGGSSSRRAVFGHTGLFTPRLISTACRLHYRRTAL
ncbi:hypothetical protein R3P38DRAFT_3582477, partial [Favolaschia claudopus]